MATTRNRGETVRNFILSQLDKHPADIVRVTADKFACSRQAVHQHLRRLIAEGMVTEQGQTRNKTYRLAVLGTWLERYDLGGTVTEHKVWREAVAPALQGLPKNVLDIWQYGFTEMFNNVIDHAGGTRVMVVFHKTATTTQISVADNGVGIFKKIQTAAGLEDERHAVLELAKGKFTTDRERHSGEGIFFSSRMFDRFVIYSGNVYFSHNFGEDEDWIVEVQQPGQGTQVGMALNNHTARTTKEVFDQFASGDDYGFSKTVVPVKLMEYGDSNLVSRSQAKRLLARFDRFKIVELDFTGIASIGQAFADEVFRVFANQHPEVELRPLAANDDVQKMISRALALRAQNNDNP